MKHFYFTQKRDRYDECERIVNIYKFKKNTPFYIGTITYRITREEAEQCVSKYLLKIGLIPSKYEEVPYYQLSDYGYNICELK